MRFFSSIKRRVLGGVLLALALVVSLIIGGNMVAKAVTTGGPPATHASGCIVGPDRQLKGFFVNSEASCGNSTPLDLGAVGAGAKGDKGDTGPSGVQALSNVVGSANLAHIGGSWVSGHTVVTTVDLPAGTYQVDLTGDFFKVVTTTATPDLQIQLNGADIQLTGYTAPFPYNAAEAVGIGTDGTPNGLEQTAPAVGIITLTSDTVVEVDAFGYNPDRSGSGGGDFDVNVRAQFIKLTPAA